VAALAGPVGVAVRERGRTIAIAAEWWSIEVLHGAVSPFRWQAQHGSALIEAALTNGVRDGAWHAGVTAVAGSIAADLAEMMTDTAPVLTRCPRHGNWLPPADPSQHVST